LIKIALCLYGQWRASDDNLHNLHEWFRKGKLVESIDVFASIKDFNTFNTTPVSKQQRQEFADKHQLTKPWTKKEIWTKITDAGLDLKSLRMHNESFDQQTMHNVNHCGVVYNTMIDSVQQKQLYEIENDIVYDLVFLTRGDVNPKGPKYGNYLKNWLWSLGLQNENNEVVQDATKLKHILDDFGYSIWISQVKMHKHLDPQPEAWFEFHRCWSDLWIAGSSLAIDAFTSTAMQMSSSQHSFNRVASHIDSHFSLELIRKQSGLQFNDWSKLPDILNGQDNLDRLNPEVIR